MSGVVIEVEVVVLLVLMDIIVARKVLKLVVLVEEEYVD